MVGARHVWGRLPATLIVALAVAGCGTGTGQGSGVPQPSTQATTTSSAGVTPQAPASTTTNEDPSHYAAQVRARAREAGVNPQLVMAILYNESYKPHDPKLERAWQKIKPDAVFGIANMHQATYDETKRGRTFATRSWQELPDDPDLAIQAASWYLHDLSARLPTQRSAGYTADELLALGYNTGPGNMIAFARGSQPGASARSYLENLRGNWAKAGQALK